MRAAPFSGDLEPTSHRRLGQPRYEAALDISAPLHANRCQRSLTSVLGFIQTAPELFVGFFVGSVLFSVQSYLMIVEIARSSNL